MKKIFITLSSFLFFGFIIVTSVFADTQIDPCPTDKSDFNVLCSLDVSRLVGPAVNFIFVLATLIALAFLIWGGLKWLMSEGDKNSVEGARNHIIAAIVGLIVIFLSYFILDLVLKFFIDAGLQDIKIPSIPTPTPTPCPPGETCN